MKLKKCVIPILALLILGSCSSDNDNELIVMDFTKNILEEVNPDFKINDIIEDVEFVPLETSDVAMLSIPSILSINENGKMCCIDYQDQSINVYDMSGKFEFKVNKRGKGNGEYLQPVYAEINENNNLDVFGLYENKMFEYDKTGNLLSETKFENGVLIAHFEKDRYAVKYNTRSNLTTHYMAISNRKGQEIEKLIEIDTLRRFDDYYSGGIKQVGNSVYF